MKRYITEIKYAATCLIDLVWADYDSLEKLNNELETLTAEGDVKYLVFIANEFHPAANHYHAQMNKAYQGIAKRKTELNKQIQDIFENIDARSASIAALSGALLQLAKQCISLRYGKPQNAPDGANISGVLVKNIIFEGRNQSIHYENPKEISESVAKLFADLDAIRKDGNTWDAKSQTNFSFEVVKFLDWRTFENFEAHLLSIESKKGS